MLPHMPYSLVFLRAMPCHARRENIPMPRVRAQCRATRLQHNICCWHCLPHPCVSTTHLSRPTLDDHRVPRGLERRGRESQASADLRQLRSSCLRLWRHVLRPGHTRTDLRLSRVRACSSCPPRCCGCSWRRDLSRSGMPLRCCGNPCRGRQTWRPRRSAPGPRAPARHDAAKPAPQHECCKRGPAC